MLDPRTLHIAMPCGDGRVMSETCGSIVGPAGKFAALSMPAEVSNVSLVRNQIASNFLASKFEWMVCLDSDIAFSVEDWKYLTEPTDDASMDVDHPQPTRIDVPQVIGRDEYGAWVTKPLPADILVVAEYPFKDESGRAIQFGMGFVRIHRS